MLNDTLRISSFQRLTHFSNEGSWFVLFPFLHYGMFHNSKPFLDVTIGISCFWLFLVFGCSCGSVVEHCVSSAKGCGFDSQGTHIVMKMYNLNAIVSCFG